MQVVLVRKFRENNYLDLLFNVVHFLDKLNMNNVNFEYIFL